MHGGGQRMGVENHVALHFLWSGVWHMGFYPYPNFFTALLPQRLQCCCSSLRTLSRLSAQDTDTMGQGSIMGRASRTFPAMNFAAFHNEIPTDNNNPQVPKSRMLLNDLKKWPFEGSVTIYLLSVGFSSQKKVLCWAARQPPGFSENTDIISEEQESTI